VIGFSDASSTSGKKGETLEDTIRMVSGYADAIVMRHPESGAAARAKAVSNLPIINAGDGSNEHPTQTLLDMFTIRETQGRLENLQIGFAGDLRYGRTVHSLAKALSDFDANQFEFIAPEQVNIPAELREFLQQKGAHFMETDEMEMQLDDLDVLYMTRMQKERFENMTDYEAVKDAYVFGAEHLAQTKGNFKILHPLPRVGEISTDIDNDPKAYYFQQAANGVPVRMALLTLMLA
jgi:aspartate carbamoyltransferase catalytic subunit